ncbi:MAG: ferrous iron transport protein A [Candidatus Zixiibacteriota bacterium]|nr:MAG: ferrous iron transport protein A [candidate division Zixibacteria bacterium]
MTYLSDMTPGQKGKVIGCMDDSPISRRLTELGFTPGRPVVYLRDAPLRDPLEVQVGHCFLSLRHSEASLVAVEVEE